MSFLEKTYEQFPIRRTDEQKTAFRVWICEQAAQTGYAARTEENGSKGKHKNVVIGDPEHADTVFTAHYDTPARSPFPNIMMPRNPVLFYIYQFAIIGAFLAVSFLVALLFNLIFHNGNASLYAALITYYILLFLMIAGPANKHNKNDNTSGVAAVLTLMEKLPENMRGRAAFILFDNEEKGKLGSKAYAKDHPDVKKYTLVVNMDCCGLGEHIILIGKNYARAKSVYALLEQSFVPENGLTPHCYGITGSVCNSDQHSFICGAVICACRKKPVVGFYTPYIHTTKDTLADDKNIDYIASSLVKFVSAAAEN